MMERLNETSRGLPRPTAAVTGPGVGAKPTVRVLPPVVPPGAEGRYTDYRVDSGYYWGVTPGGMMERLGEVPGWSEGTQYIIQGPPPVPPAGSTKKQIRAYAETMAAYERAFMGSTLPMSTRAENIYQSLLRPGGSKERSLLQQYAQQQGNIVSSSGTLVPLQGGGYGNITTGEVFTPTTTSQVIAQPSGGITIPEYTVTTPQLPGWLGGIAKLASVGGPLKPIADVVKGLWQAGEFMGVQYLLGKSSEAVAKQEQVYRDQGIIAGPPDAPVWTGTQQELNRYLGEVGKFQALQQEHDTRIDQMFGGKRPGAAQLVTYPFYETMHGAAEQYTAIVGKPAGEAISHWTSGSSDPRIQTLWERRKAMYPLSSAVIEQFGAGGLRGLVEFGPPAAIEFMGMAPVGSEVLARHPEAIVPMAALGLKMQAEGIGEGLMTRPGEFMGESLLLIGATHGIGKGIKTITPIKYTGPMLFEREGLPSVRYRGLYAESPYTSIKKAFGYAPEWYRTTNLGGITRGAGRTTFTTGVPKHLEPYIRYEGFTPWYGRSVVEVPLYRRFLQREGAPGSVAALDTTLSEITSLYRVRPTTIRQPAQAIEQVSVIKPGTGEEFLSMIRRVAPEHKFTGTVSQYMQSRRAPIPHDVDIYVENPRLVADTAAKQYFGKYYGPENVRVAGGQVKIQRAGNWQTAMDALDISEHTGYMAFGVKSQPPITVEGLRFTPLSEQLLRKTVGGGFMMKTEKGWTPSPARHRGKDIADVIGGIEDQIVSYQLRGKPVPPRLIETKAQYQRMLAPESPLNQLYNPRTGRSIVEDAQLRLGTYTTDYTPTEYTRMPLSRTYRDLSRFSVIESRVLNPMFERLGIGFGTRWVPTGKANPSGIGERYPVETPVFGGAKYPTVVPFSVAGIPGFVLPSYPGGISQVDIGVGYPPLARPSPGGYPASSISTPSIRYPTVSIAGGDARYPSVVPKAGGMPYPKTSPGYPVQVAVSQYPTTFLPGGKYPPTLSVGKYPSTIPTRGYPPTIPVRGYPPSVPTRGYPPSAPKAPTSKYPLTTTGITGKASYPGLFELPKRIAIPYPKSPAVTIPPIRQRYYLKEETPPKPPKLRLHFDVLASKWNIINPIPRPGGAGVYPGDVLKIFNKQYSRKKLVYVKSLPFEQFANIDVKVKKVI